MSFLCMIVSSFATFESFAKESDSETEFREIIGSGIFDVNKTRKFVLDNNSKLYLDAVEIDIEHFEIIGSGFKSTFTVNLDTSSAVDAGTINAIELTTNLKGPVTSLNPLMVLEQPVLQTSDTVKTNFSELKLNQNLTISGYLSTNNSLKASRIMTNESDWKIRGFASDVNNNSFKIGTLIINRFSEQLLDCDKGFNNGSLVEVKMAVDVNYQVGVPIETIQSIRCLTRNRLAGEQIVLPSVNQGFISQTQGQGFWLDDVKVVVNNATEYINGEIDFIDDAVNVEVQGTFDTATSEIQADVIRFMDRRVEITFPVQSSDIVIGESVTILGTTFYKTPQTKDNAKILSSGMAQPIQVEIQGFLDSEGKAYISKTLDKGLVDYNNVSLRGSISNLNNPEVTVLNNIIDATDSLIIKLGTGVIDINTFFLEIVEGSQIDIKNAVYNTVSGKFTNGMITIRKTDNKVVDNVTREIIGSGIFGAIVTATITATADQIFVSGFE